MRLILKGFDTIQALLDRHLSTSLDCPVAVAVSGGGDSVALMHLAADWTQRHGRRLLVLSVDHRLSPEGAQWNGRVAVAAQSLKADWCNLVWSEPKPTTGLAAAARAARHALLATAARDAGAKVVLMGHTADDVAEADWMRAQGTPLGRLRVWGPSPAWPDGRGIMLLRPLLDIRRQALRDWLEARDIGWVEDPANLDPRFHRSRARAAQPDIGGRSHAIPPPRDYTCDPGSGLVELPLESPWLAHALAAASGRSDLPGGQAVAQLRERLRGGGRPGVLGGTRIEIGAGGLSLSREPGRRPPRDLSLWPGQVQIWDGRFMVRAATPGWHIGAAQGRRARLSVVDRAALARLPPGARAGHPVLFQHDDTSPLLASAQVEVTCLVPGRLSLATGQVRSEDELAAEPWREPIRHPI
ncbi:MAG: tRNA lysidine(34) synthetase TilS [Caulobacterales bacterium]|nr:tRNA lysidine(34) synthetase TilS [Caulobacterales bacterium]